MKKIISILISAIMLFTSVSAMAAVEVNKLDCENWICSGTSEAGTLVTAVLYKGEKIGTSYNDVLAVADTRADEEKKFSFNLNINGDKMKTGDLVTAFVRMGEESETKTFKYLSSSVKEEIFQIIKGAGAAGKIAEILLSEENADKFSNAEMDIEAFKNMPKEAKDNVSEILYSYCADAESDENKICDVYAKAVALNNFYNGSKYDAAEDFNSISGLLYNEVKWEDVKDKDYVTAYMKENGPYKTEEEVQSAFAYAYALSVINSIDAHGKVKDTLKGFEELLNLDSLDYYDDYKKVSEKAAVNKKFVSVIGSSKIKNADDLDEILKKAVNAASDGGSSSGGGGGGGKSTGSVASVAPVLKTETSQGGAAEKTEDKVFSDIDSSHWAYESVMSLYNSGNINGYEDGSFRPDKSVTREEFVKMMISSLDITETGGTVPFNDVEYGKWYSTYIATAWRKGLVNGVEKTKFGMGMSITRQDMATMIYRAAGELGYDFSAFEGESVSFADGDRISDYAKEAVEVLSKAGVINGADGNFMPEKTATRAEVAKILNSLIELN